jgi:hypothetical protein
MESVKAILEAEGTSVEEMGVQETYNYYSGDSGLEVQHLYEDRMSVKEYDKDYKLVRNLRPAMKFIECEEGEWVPIYYRDDRHDLVKRTSIQDPDVIEDLTELMHQWDELLKCRFPADEVVD